MIKKIKLNQLAKDLNVNNNDIISLIQEKTGEVKKSVNALNDAEVNLVINHYTNLLAVKDFDGYYKLSKNDFDKKEEKAKENKKQPKEQEKAEKSIESTEKIQKDKVAPKIEKNEKINIKDNVLNEVISIETNNNNKETVKNENDLNSKVVENKTAENKPVFDKPTENKPNAEAPAQFKPNTNQAFKPREHNNQNNNNNTNQRNNNYQQRPNNNYQGGQNNPNNQNNQGNGNYQQRNNNYQQRPNNNYQGGQNNPSNQNNQNNQGNNNYQQRNNFNNNRVNNNNNNNNNFNNRNNSTNNANTNNVVKKPPLEGPKERVVRHVDTKTVDVNLDKYNERYEKLSTDNTRKNSDNFQRKQKLNQKSAQRGKQKYSNKVETDAQKLQRLALEKARKQQLKIVIPDEISVTDLAIKLKVNVAMVIKKLIGLGIMATQNEIIDFDTASLVADELGAKVEHEVVITIEERLIDDSSDDEGNTEPRDPIVVVMGHVDHGKTSLLDNIRKAKVTDGEAGGITQHIGAYRVKAGDKHITFLDTPGHEAFTAIRARGASITDIAILVVAADDGIMPQTVEAINHAKAAGVKIIIAINKIDKQSANIEKVKQELTQHELVPEEWGGDVICCPVSALTGEGIDNLLEMVNLVAEMAEYKANPKRLAKGTVIEAKLDKSRGPVATVLVQNGTLRATDIILAGTTVGRIRAMNNDLGEPCEEAGPSFPVEIIGLDEVPAAGDTFNVVENERLARELVDQRKYEQKEAIFNQFQKVTLDNLFNQIAQGQMKELPIIIKADVQGSYEAVKQSLEKLTNEEVRVRVIHGGVGAVNKSDLMLAQAAGAIIIGFNVRPDATVKDLNSQEGVELRLYRIIYDAIDDVKQAMKGLLDPKTREIELGTAEVRNVFKITGSGVIAGCYVTSGKVVRSALIRLVRDGIVITEDKISSLKRFKDDQKEVAHGYECGIGLEKYNDIKEGDIFESFIIEEYRD